MFLGFIIPAALVAVFYKINSDIGLVFVINEIDLFIGLVGVLHEKPLSLVAISLMAVIDLENA